LYRRRGPLRVSQSNDALTANEAMTVGLVKPGRSDFDGRLEQIQAESAARN
jgi:hypothetical protein